jgi:hypothetical protein
MTIINILFTLAFIVSVIFIISLFGVLLGLDPYALPFATAFILMFLTMFK